MIAGPLSLLKVNLTKASLHNLVLIIIAWKSGFVNRWFNEKKG